MVLAASVAQDIANVPFAHEVAGLVQPVAEAQNEAAPIDLRSLLP